MIRLGVNIDHVATLRQLRAGSVTYPNVVESARLCLKSGADQITVHLRSDRRHIQDSDLKNLMAEKCPINLEMGATDEMVRIAVKAKPQICCLVPEKRQELTTEGGLDLLKNTKKIEKAITTLKKAGIDVSLFIECAPKQVKMAKLLNADAVEFHTGQFALAKEKSQMREWEKLKNGCELAHAARMRIHAGHGLDYENVLKIKTLPFLEELNIGHSIVCRAVFVGLESAVREMKNLVS